MIEIDGLTKRYGDKTAVDQLSFVVEPGAHGSCGRGRPWRQRPRKPRSWPRVWHRLLT